MADRDCPKVAVLIACYNHELFIRDCLLSVIEQDYKNLSIYIYDDCSSDSSVAKISSFLKGVDVEYHFESHPNNLGIAGNYNAMIEACLLDPEIEFVIPFAGDDIMLSNKVSCQVAALLEDESASFSYSNMSWFSSDSGKVLFNHFGFINKASTDVNVLISDALVPTPTLCISRWALEAVRFNDNFKYLNDYILVIDLCMISAPIYVDKALVKYRKHTSSVMSTVLFLEEREEAGAYVVSRYGRKYYTSADKFSKTALFDYLVKYYFEKEFNSAFKCFFRLLPKFFSSRKWFLRLLKFFAIVFGSLKNLNNYGRG